MRGSFVLGIALACGAPFAGAAAATKSSDARAAGTSQAAPNPRGEAELARLIADKTAGKPVSCIDLHDVESTEVLDGTAIVYRVSGNKLYVNRPTIGSDWLDSDDILVTHSYAPQLCRVDTVRLVDRGSLFERGFVGLGDFVPYTKVR